MKGFDLREGLRAKAVALAALAGEHDLTGIAYCPASGGYCSEKDCFCCQHSGLHAGQTSTCPECGKVSCSECWEQHWECCSKTQNHSYGSRSCSRCGAYFCSACSQYCEEGRYSYMTCPVCGQADYDYYPPSPCAGDNGFKHCDDIKVCDCGADYCASCSHPGANGRQHCPVCRKEVADWLPKGVKYLDGKTSFRFEGHGLHACHCKHEPGTPHAPHKRGKDYYTNAHGWCEEYCRGQEGQTPDGYLRISVRHDWAGSAHCTSLYSGHWEIIP